MRPHVTRRTMKFGKFNPRTEKHGKDSKHASDLVVSFPITRAELDMYMPVTHGLLISDSIYDEKGNLQTPYLSPLTVNRNPEGVRFRVWDRPTNQEDHIELEGCKLKGFKIVLNDKGNITCSTLIQMHDDPELHSARLRMLSDKEFDGELEVLQEEMFVTMTPADVEDEPEQIDIETVETKEDEPETAGA